jgi:hypothetical protein
MRCDFCLGEVSEAAHAGDLRRCYTCCAWADMISMSNTDRGARWRPKANDQLREHSHRRMALADGRVKVDMPIGVLFRGLETVHGVDSFEVQTYGEGGMTEKVFVLCTEVARRPVASVPGDLREEVGL